MINEIGDTEKGQYALGRLRAKKFKKDGVKKANEIGKYAEKAREKSSLSTKTVDGCNDTFYSPSKYKNLTDSHANGWHDEMHKNESTKKNLNLTENAIRNIVRSVINEMFDESTIPYDKNFLDGIDSIDNRSINYFIQSMIPSGNRVSKNSPYKPIRQLVLYFSPEGAVKHGGRLTKDIVNHIMRNDALRKKIYEISQYDRKILDLIYGKNKLTGKPLMQQIIWNLDAILSEMVEFNNIVSSSNIRNYFDGTEALNGAKDGKRVGLTSIIFKAFTGIDEIKSQIKKMQEILDKGRDAFSYNTGKFNRK